jgi:transglutaminase-like putative cysteine protease
MDRMNRPRLLRAAVLSAAALLVAAIAAFLPGRPTPASADDGPGPGPVPPATTGGMDPAAPSAPAAPAVRRWYEALRDGQRRGTLEVVWVPSTWQGHVTVRDTTREVTVEARDMAGTTDVFETESVTTTERGEDGTLWWTRSVLTEAGGRETVSETTWTGNGYDLVTTLGGNEERRRVDAKEPATLDVESFLGPRLVRGEAKAGQTLPMRVLDGHRRAVVEHALEVVGVEDVTGEDGPVPCTKVREKDPDGSVTTWWIDRTGAVARLKAPPTEVRRVSAAAARKRSAEPASFSITVAAEPPVERVFTADRMLVDVHLRGDPDRPVPPFPDSPWSRVLSKEGSDAKGWVVHAEFLAHDDRDAKATIPVADPAFARHLEPTVLMPCQHPDVLGQARKTVGTEKDARKAVQRIADFVYTLRKKSGDVGEASAVEILRDRQGDCSEHATLFVALCRAAGIPARRCSGYVSVGELWGAHAWAEVWTGAWIGVDPTTDDVGTSARYLFFGYSDDPDSRPGLVSSWATGRMRFETTRLWEAGREYDLSEPATWRSVDAEKRTAVHALAGIEARAWPEDWTVTLSGHNQAHVKGPGFTCRVEASADQGLRGERLLKAVGRAMAGASTTFAGAPARILSDGTSRRVFASSRRRIVRVDLDVTEGGPDPDATLTAIGKAFAPTFEPSPRGW